MQLSLRGIKVLDNKNSRIKKADGEQLNINMPNTYPPQHIGNTRKKFCDVQYSILRPSDYEFIAFPAEITSQPVGVQNFLTRLQHHSYQVAFTQLHIICSQIQLLNVEEIDYCSNNGVVDIGLIKA